MIDEQNKYTTLENELRQCLLRGYTRLRQAQAQGRHLEEAECVLELLGDPQLLTLEHPKYKWKLRIPLIYVASWDLKKGQRIKNALDAVPHDILTMYRRKHKQEEPGQKIIHDKLVAAIQHYIQESDSRGLLYDLTWAPRPDEYDHDEISSENWCNFQARIDNPHWLFGDTNPEDLPEHLWRVNSLVRMSFPISPQKRVYPYKMITLILGFAIEPSELNNSGWDDKARKEGMRWIRRLARIIITDVIHLYSIVENRKSSGRIQLSPPDWLKQSQRNALHLAVDDLHRRIIEFATRVGMVGWDKPENGFNFLIAFKELNWEYRACLRYGLTVYNLHALGAGAKDVLDWRALFEDKLSINEKQLQELFLRSGKANEDFRSYLRECREAISEIFDGVQTLEEARIKVMTMAESTPYPMRLTPGYYVMSLSHPEIIQTWLRDPRAKSFDKYPKNLLAWESTALPNRIYYSQVADGTLSVGVCGVNADILDKCPAYYELQELIDESGPRFRYIISEGEFSQLVEELKEDLKMKKGRPRLWASALRRFRRLGYYHFQNPWDYHTKLVYDGQIKHFDRRPWINHKDGQWQELCNLNKGDIPILMNSDHIPLKEGWTDQTKPQLQSVDGDQDFYEEDFLKLYLSNYLREGWAENRPDLEGARLHRIKMRGTSDRDQGDTSLLILVPDPQNNEFARQLIHRFVTQCDLAFEDYERAIEWIKTYSEKPTDQLEDDSYHVFLCYNHEDRDEVKAIAEQLKKYGIRPWLDESELRPGTPWLDTLQSQLSSIESAAVFIGKSGIGPWQKMEVNSVLSKFVSMGRIIIPVILLGGNKPGAIPFFLENFQWVDFNSADPDPIKQLKWGITGERKEVPI